MGFQSTDEKSRNAMLSFIQKSFTQPKTIFSNDFFSTEYFLCAEPDLAYIDKAYSIGFDYTKCPEDSVDNYLDSILAWMASKVGAQIEFLGKPYKYLDYDGSEKFLIINPGSEIYDSSCLPGTEEFEDFTGQIFLSEKGVSPIKPSCRILRWLGMGVSVKKSELHTKAIENELARLNVLWESTNK